ncbi:MAG: hypothetical protein ACP6IY_19515 [Promethearchaeia archaeon]
MKKITFHKGTFLLTDKEFEEAKIAWKKKNNYYCQRLGATISDRFQFARTPENELGYKIYLYKHQNGGMAKIFEQNGNFYKEIGEKNNTEKILMRVDEELKGKMVDQEIFYQIKQPQFKALKS